MVVRSRGQRTASICAVEPGAAVVVSGNEALLVLPLRSTRKALVAELSVMVTT